MLDKRLKTVLNFIRGCSVLYDIGSDHAYLPIQAIKDGRIKKAYAVDNKNEPLNAATDNILTHNLSQSITPVLSDGLEALTTDVDCISVCGLGGKTIHDIMQSLGDSKVQRLILQPNNHAQLVRQLVHKIPYRIIEETIVHQKDETYPVIIMEKGSQTLDTIDLYVGPILRKYPTQPYIESLQKEYLFLDDLIAKIPDENAKIPLIKKRDLLEAVFNEWRHNQKIL